MNLKRVESPFVFRVGLGLRRQAPVHVTRLTRMSKSGKERPTPESGRYLERDDFEVKKIPEKIQDFFSAETSCHRPYLSEDARPDRRTHRGCGANNAILVAVETGPLV